MEMEAGATLMEGENDAGGPAVDDSTTPDLLRPLLFTDFFNAFEDDFDDSDV